LIDWLSSKVAMAMAVLVITGSVLGYFAYQRSASYEHEVEEVARSTARYAEAFSTLSGEVRVTITLGPGGNLELPASINGKPVTVNITNSMVIVTCGKYAVSETHTVTYLHFWATGNRSMNTTAMAQLDLDNRWTGELASPKKIVLERRAIYASGTEQLFTFCYPLAHLPV
jgi:hypothetical protein